MDSGPDSGTTGDALPKGGYPVVDSAELEPVRHRILRRPRRSLGEIPRQPPGTVLVFQTGESYEVLSEPALRLDATLVVEAVAVAVVSKRHTLREAVAYLPCADPGMCVSVRARFHCWVTDPQLVLDSGCWDIDPFLTDHLVGDRRLRFLAQANDLATGWDLFHRNATARMIAYHDLHPLVVPGISARLVDVALDLQRLATVPRARSTGSAPEPPPATEPHGDGVPDDVPGDDGNPSFVSHHYTWEGRS